MRSDDARASVKSAEVLLDRAWGRPEQKQELTGADGKPLVDPSAIAKAVLSFAETNVIDADRPQLTDAEPEKAT